MVTAIETARSVDYQTREDWLAARRNSVGASEVAALFGCNPYMTAFDVWAEKALGVVEPVSDESEIAMAAGHALEPLISERYEKRTGLKLEDPGDFRVWHHPDVPLSCTLDRFVLYQEPWDRVVELKNTSSSDVMGAYRDGTPPLSHQMQLQVQMGLTGLSRGSLACLGGLRHLYVEDLVAKSDFFELVLKKVDEFWGLVKRKEQPEITGAKSTTAVLKALHPLDNGESVILEADIVDVCEQYELYKIAEKEIKDQKAGAYNEIIAAIGDNTWANAADQWYSYKHQTQKGDLKLALTDENRAALDAAGIHYDVTEASDSRVLRKSTKEPK